MTAARHAPVRRTGRLPHPTEPRWNARHMRCPSPHSARTESGASASCSSRSTWLMPARDVHVGGGSREDGGGRCEGRAGEDWRNGSTSAWEHLLSGIGRTQPVGRSHGHRARQPQRTRTAAVPPGSAPTALALLLSTGATFSFTPPVEVMPGPEAAALSVPGHTTCAPGDSHTGLDRVAVAARDSSRGPPVHRPC